MLIKIITFLIFSSLVSIFARTFHTISIDGSLNDFHPDELIYEDSANDSPWSVFNEVHKLYLTWDDENLYIGVRAVQKDGNHLIVYIDTHTTPAPLNTGPEYTRGDIFNNWYWGKNHKFPKDFRPDLQWSLWQMKLFEKIEEGERKDLMEKGLYKFTSTKTYEDVNAHVQQASSGDGPQDTTGKYHEAEIKIPFSLLYPTGFPKGATIKIIVAMTGGTNLNENLYGSAHDTIPNQSNQFTPEWYGLFEFIEYLTIKIDENEDGFPDKDTSPIPRNFSYKIEENEIKLSWKKREIIERDIKNFIVEYSTNQTYTPLSTITTTETSLTISPISYHVTYYIKLSPEYIIQDATYTFKGGINELIIPPIYIPLVNKTPKNHPYVDKKVKFVLESPQIANISTITLYYKFADELAYNRVEMKKTDFQYIHELDPQIIPEYIEYYFIVNTTSPITIIKSFPENAPTKSLIITFKPTSFQKTYPNQENIIQLDEYTKLIIPPYSLQKEEIISLEYLNLNYIYELNPPKDSQPITLYKIKPENIPFRPSILQLKYFEEDIEGVNENLLSIYHFTGIDWVKLNSTVNTNNKTITAEITNSGTYAILYLPAQQKGTKLKKIINPTFFTTRNEELIFEFEEPMEVELSIFDIAGQIIEKATANSNIIKWDGKDFDKKTVESGLYIYQLKFSDELISGICIVGK